jgi:hypothetical protein
MSKDSIVTARKSFGINEDNILNASSIENSKKQGLKSDAEINMMTGSSSASTNSSKNKSML